MFRYSSRTLVALLVVTAVIASCSDGASPARPSGVRPGITSPAAGLVSPGVPTPAELRERGWTCFVPPPFPTRTVCSHPNQGLPPIPPPPDRPETFNLWIYENGEFVGRNHLIRPDLYCGADRTDPAGTCTRIAPLCESTGEPYFFASVIGYYECLHTPGK